MITMAEEIRIGHLSTLYHTSFILKGSKIAEELGVRIRWRLFPTGPDIVDAFERGWLDLGYIGLPPAIAGIGRGLEIKCVAGGHIEGTVLVGSRGFLPFKTVSESLAQFRGGSIGTPRKGSIHDVIMRKLVRDACLDDQVEIKNYDWADFILDAMIDGDVEGGCGTPPLAVLVTQRLKASIILPPEVMWPYNPSYGIVATERLIEDSTQFLEEFLRRHEEACNFIRMRPKEAAEKVAGGWGVIDPEFALEVFKISPKYCASLPERYIASTVAFAALLTETGDIPRELDEEEVFDTRAITRVHLERDHYGDPGNLYIRKSGSQL